MKVGILTGGGDCPGLNAVIRGAVRTVCNAGGEVVGLLEGWRGAIEGNTTPLTPQNTQEIVGRGGTILGSSRTNPYTDKAKLTQLVDTFGKLGLDALIAIGGDDTLGVADKLSRGIDLDSPLPAVGVPKTIDNDLSCTDVTFGFYTSIDIVTEAVDRLRTTADSHRRVMVVETMGRHAGWIALFSGIATAADYTLVPEEEIDVDKMCDILKKRREQGSTHGIVVVSEGAKLPKSSGYITTSGEVDEFGHVALGGIGEKIAQIIEEKTGIETRDVKLGHLQRGGPPNAFDRVLGTRLGLKAGQLVLDKEFGKMVAIHGTEVVAVPLQEAVGTMRTVEQNFLDEAAAFYT